MMIIASDTERRVASLQESFFSQSLGNFKQRDIWETIVFFRYGLWNKKMFIFHYIIDNRDEPARLGPAVTLLDTVFLSQFKSYKN